MSRLVQELKTKKILRQAISFLLISGTGFILDFTVFFILTYYLGVGVSHANMISSVPAVTYVFFTSIKKTFDVKNEGLPIWGKYLLYFGYQILLVTLVSTLAQLLYNTCYPNVLQCPIVLQYFKLITNFIITPITMTFNFFVMKLLSEKI